MNPTGILKEEHQGVKMSLRILEQVCARLEQGKKEDTDALQQLLAFFRIFVDTCHHAKEEELLFPALIEAGLPEKAGPVQVMLQEHILGRNLVVRLELALGNFMTGKETDLTNLLATAREYSQLLMEHIDKEDHVLYPVADARIAESVQMKLAEDFERIETERIGKGRHEQFHAMLEEFQARYLPGGPVF